MKSKLPIVKFLIGLNCQKNNYERILSITARRDNVCADVKNFSGKFKTMNCRTSNHVQFIKIEIRLFLAKLSIKMLVANWLHFSLYKKFLGSIIE